MNQLGRWERIALWALPVVLGIGLAWKHPGYMTKPLYLGGVLLVEIMVISLWGYKRIFLPLIMLFFLWSGSSVPGARLANSARWAVLGVGAFGGAVIWIAGHRRSYSQLHMVASFATIAALTSALVSNDPQGAALKAASLFLLFLYCSTGLRLAMQGREARFVNGMRVACEISVFATAAAYAVGWQLWGNPNALGAVMSIGVLPFLIWGFLTAETRKRKYTAVLTIVLCSVLLYFALSRASILASIATMIAVCIGLRRQHLLMKMAFAAVMFLALAAVLDPTRLTEFISSTTNEWLHKGKDGASVFASRQSPWEETVSSLRKHPWFGTGFGTSDMGATQLKVTNLSVTKGINTLTGSNREHGNSYLALAEYVGVVGSIPFLWLLIIVAKMMLRVFVWMRKNGDPRYCGIPLATVIIAGLVHALFEDWMFAVGSYLCVFFWVCVFQLNDVLPPTDSVPLRAASPACHPASAAIHPALAPQR